MSIQPYHDRGMNYMCLKIMGYGYRWYAHIRMGIWQTLQHIRDEIKNHEMF